MDSDIEEAQGLVNPTNCETGDPLRVFIFFPLKFPKNIPLTLFNWKKFMIVAWGIQLMFFVSLAGLIKPLWTFYTKVAIITAAVAPLVGYCMVLLTCSTEDGAVRIQGSGATCVSCTWQGTTPYGGEYQV